MNWHFTAYAIPVIIGAPLALVVALKASRCGERPGTRPLIVLLLALAEWSLAYAFELLAADLPDKVFWAKLSYLGVVTTPLAWLVFGLRYTGGGSWLSTRNLALLAIEPIITLALVWSNEVHGLIWSEVRLDSSGPFPILEVGHGAWFWVHVAFSYVQVLIGSTRLLWTLLHSPEMYRQQAGGLLVAVLAPWLGNALYLSGLQPIPGLDLTPLAFTVSGLALGWSLLRLRLLDLFPGLIPIARDAIIDAMRDAVIVLDDQDRVGDLNRAAELLLGSSLQALRGKSADDVLAAWPEVRRHVHDRSELSAEVSLGEGDSQRSYDVLGSPLRERDGPAGRLIVFRDITERKRAEERLRQAEEKYREIVEQAVGGIYQSTPDGRFLTANAALARIFGYSSPQELISSVTDLARQVYVHPARRAEFLQQLETDGVVTAFEMEVVRKDGSRIWISHNARAVSDAQGKLLYCEGSVEDVTERKRMEETLARLALQDPLTGLPNRTLLQDRLQQAILAARRDSRVLSLLLLDLDRFKDVNDTLGHHLGDLVLQEVGRRLQGALRASDTVARLGGDEFAVLLASAEDVAGARAAAQRLQDALRAPCTIEGHQLEVGASIGIALFPEHGEDGETLLRHADIAMYVAKRAYAWFAVYDPELDQYSPGRLALISELRAAIERGELVLHYQPLVDIRSGEITHVEALVRWQHPQRGLLGPDTFVPLAEQTGLISALSAWVLNAALQQCCKWRAAGLELCVAVNVSMQDLHDPHLPDTVGQLLETWAVPSDALILEITEGALMADARRAISVLDRLRLLGVRIAIDDFGTGYSSLAYLKHLRVDALKVDRSFVLDMAQDENDLAIVRASVEMGGSLGFQVVAEGVEDQKTWDLLAKLGCDVAQGYYLTRPLPAEALVAWIDGCDRAVSVTRKAIAS